MSIGYRGKEIFKPLNTGWIDDRVACVREWVANIFFYTKNGTTIMIDAGYNYGRLAEKMKWLNIKPSTIGHILITHQDTDHVGAVERDSDGLFGKATLYLSAVENRYLTGDVRRKVIFGAYKLPMVKTDNRRVLLTDGEVFQIGDIKIEAFLVPGHTWGHMAYLVDDAYLFTGDAVWFGADGGYDEGDDTEEKARGRRIVSVGGRRRRKVLVFGAGVIGSYLAHVLCEAGNEVTVLARETRAESLNQNGLVIRHHLQGKVTRDRVEAVTSVKGRSFDAAFAVMPYHKLKAALGEICGLQAKLLVLVGNDITPSEIGRHITENAPGIRKILFGFQATAGKKEENRYICERLGGGMEIGQLHGRTDLRLQKWVQRMFDGTDYRLKWQDDMESYLICHLAAILPIAYLTYICDGDLRKSTGRQRKRMLLASHEAYEFLKGKGIPIYPANDDKYFDKGIRGGLMSLLYFMMAKTKIGDMVACEHCKNSVSEMEQLDRYYEKLMHGYPVEKLKVWRKLRSQMPPWEELHKKYGN